MRTRLFRDGIGCGCWCHPKHREYETTRAPLAMAKVTMSELDSPAVQAALRTESRLTSVENIQASTLETLQRMETRLEKIETHLATQNGRLAKSEDAVLGIKQQIMDYEDLVAKPRWASFETVKTKVEKMWEDFSLNGRASERREKFWSALKRRADIILIGVSIVVALRIEDIAQVFGG